uniref:Transposase n=1 Tax=Peronospora matthiolae TaxID=2874970 RepID=A0AAV1TG03_9STRA
MTRYPRRQPTKLDINDSLAQLSVTKPDAADKCRADLLEAIRRTRRILVRFEKHLDTAQRSDSRKHIKTWLVAHASDLLSLESTVSLRISREISKHTSKTARVPYSGPPGYKVMLARQQPTAKPTKSWKPGSKVIKRSTKTIAPPSTIN